MTKSNGIKSLKQAAKLLNKHAPDGESLAYINPEEARVLRARGSSGIMTVAGVPSYFLDKLWEGAKALGKSFLGRYKDQPEVYNKAGTKVIQAAQSGFGNVVQDALSVWGALRAKKDKEGLNAAEMEQFNKLNQQLAAAETEFDVGTDFGTQLKAPQYTTDVADVAAYTPIDFSGSTTPDLTLDAKAQGGRIGFNEGTNFQTWLKNNNHPAVHELSWDQYSALSKLFRSEHAPGEAQGGRIGYQDGSWNWRERLNYLMNKKAGGGVLTDDEEDELLHIQITILDVDRSGEAQGGRIGAFNGGIQGLMPQQGFMPQPGLDPRMGYAYGNPHGVEKFDLANLDSLEGLRDPFKTSPEMIEIHEDYDIESMRDPFKTSGEMQEIQKDYDIESMRDPFKPSEIQKLVQEIMKVYENIEVKDAIALATKMLQDVQNQGRAQGGRIGAQEGGIMPLLNLGGMEKDYRQDGGFVPIGRKEKADDVPARLSKNEFVFTADAVRAAGGGDIDEGAQRMYNVMKNLEAGGDISEQSQGKA